MRFFKKGAYLYKIVDEDWGLFVCNVVGFEKVGKMNKDTIASLFRAIKTGEAKDATSEEFLEEYNRVKDTINKILLTT